jgi:serine/threonine protein kinase
MSDESSLYPMPVTRGQKRNREYQNANAFIAERNASPSRNSEKSQNFSLKKRRSTVKPAKPFPANATRVSYEFSPVTRMTPELPGWFTTMRKNSRFIAGGVFGKVYELNREDIKVLLQSIRAYASRSKDGGHAEFVRFPPRDKRIVMKVSDLDENRDRSIVAFQEVKTLRALRGLSFVPTLYGTVRFVDPVTGSWYQVIVMSYVDGIQLMSAIDWNWLREPYDMDKVRRKLNTALIRMWKRGVLHTDLHTSNVLITKDSNVHIIDFGFSIQSSFVKKLASRFTTNQNAVVLWKKYLEAFANVLVARNRRSLYNPNGNILLYLQSNHFQRPQLRNQDIPRTSQIKRVTDRIREAGGSHDMSGFLENWTYGAAERKSLQSEFTRRVKQKYQKIRRNRKGV